MASEVDIWNMALFFLKEKNAIQSEDDTSSKAGSCRLFYPTARKAVLESCDWSFARKYEALALHQDDPPSSGWSYMYAYPSDCLKARFIDDGMRQLGRPPIPYKIVNHEGSKMIMANVADPVLCYTIDVKDPNKFTNLFTITLAWYLATMLAPSLTDNKMLSVAENGYMKSVGQAIAENHNEEQEEIDYGSTLNSPTMSARE